MKFRRAFPVVAAALALAFAFPLTVRTGENGNDQKPPTDIRVDFGDPVTLAGTANQVVIPEDATIQKGGTVTFVVNGGATASRYIRSARTQHARPLPRSSAPTIR